MRLDTGGSAREKRAFGVFRVLVDLGREALFGRHCRFGIAALPARWSSSFESINSTVWMAGGWPTSWKLSWCSR